MCTYCFRASIAAFTRLGKKKQTNKQKKKNKKKTLVNNYFE